MKISARNTLPGTIRGIEPGAVNAEVTLELAPGLTVVSIITMDAAHRCRCFARDDACSTVT